MQCYQSWLCNYLYGTRCHHKREAWYKTLALQLTILILKVPYGFNNHTNTYPSLAHMWQYWYKEWYLDTMYQQSPWTIMVRHKDLVFLTGKGYPTYSSMKNNPLIEARVIVMRAYPEWLMPWLNTVNHYTISKFNTIMTIRLYCGCITW